MLLAEDWLKEMGHEKKEEPIGKQKGRRSRRRMKRISLSPGMACGWVPHHHHLGDVPELAEVLLQPLLRSLP